MKKLVSVAAAVLVIIGIGAAAVYLRPAAKPQATPGPTASYVALGDSVAAGVGLEPDSDSSACNRTDAAYSHAVATKANLALTSVACSGATIPAGLGGPQEVNKLSVKAQVDQLFALPRPQLVTITIGANDAGWQEAMAKCFAATCGSAADTAATATKLAGMGQALRGQLDRIKAHYGAAVPRVIVTGYHQVLPVTAAPSCADLRGIDEAELSWTRQQQNRLNLTLMTAVGLYDFARFAPVDFSGHELCSADSWVQGGGDAQPYHPTAAGQSAYADAVAKAREAAK